MTPNANAVRLTADALPQVPASASHKSKKQQAAAAAAAASKAAADADAAAAALAADVIAVTIPSLPEKEINVGPVRHRICEPLLAGKTPGGDTVWEALGRAVENASLTVPERLFIWDSIAVIGDIARFKCACSFIHLFLETPKDVTDNQPSRPRW